MTIQKIVTEHNRDSSAQTDDLFGILGTLPNLRAKERPRALQADEENASGNTDGPEVQHLPLAEDDSLEVEVLPTREAASSDEQPAPPASHNGPDGGGPMSVSEAAENAQPVQGAPSDGASSSQPDEGRLGSIDEAIENAQPVHSADETSTDGESQDIEVTRPEVTYPDSDSDDVENIVLPLTYPDRDAGGSTSPTVSELIDQDVPEQTDSAAMQDWVRDLVGDTFHQCRRYLVASLPRRHRPDFPAQPCPA